MKLRKPREIDVEVEDTAQGHSFVVGVYEKEGGTWGRGWKLTGMPRRPQKKETL